MRKSIILLVLISLTVTSAEILAGSGARQGTAGAAELTIPVGARGSSLGGAAVANPSGLESIYWNPAGLVSLEGSNFMFSIQPYIADIDVSFFAAATTIESFGTLAVSFKSVAIGDMLETTAAAPDGTGRIFSPRLTVLGLSYARDLTTSVSMGTTAMLINESIFEVTASGVAFDLGLSYVPFGKDVALGITLKNYGPSMRFSGPGFEQLVVDGHHLAAKSASFELPSSLNVGMSYNFVTSEMNRATVLGNFRSNNFSEDNWQGGVEYAYNERYFVRGGYNYSKDDRWLYGFTAGLGATIPLGESHLTFEYSFADTDVFQGSNQSWVVTFGL
jgi:hypothetical protein